MKPFPLGNEVVTLLMRADVEDGQGNAVRDAYRTKQMTATSVVVNGCSWRLLSAQEHNLDTNPTDLVVRAMLPIMDPQTGATTPIPLSTAAATWEQQPDDLFELQGPGRLVVDSLGTLDHIVFLARCRKG